MSSVIDQAWRWNRAIAYHDNSAVPPRIEDPKVKVAVRYLTRLNKDDSLMNQVVLERMYPATHGAYKLWEMPTGPRWYIEAMVLAGASVEDISCYLGQDIDVIETYEALFFDVRDRVSNKGFVISQILSKSIERGLFDREFDFLWKLLSLVIGLDGLKNYWESGKLDAKVTDELVGVLKAKLLKDAVTAAHVRRINQYNANEVIAQYLESATNDKTGETENKQKLVVSGLQAVLDSMQFNVLPVTAKSDGAIEPRVDKLLENLGVTNE